MPFSEYSFHVEDYRFLVNELESICLTASIHFKYLKTIVYKLKLAN